MPDLHDLLERRARTLRPQPLPAAFDRTMRRAGRRHRNRRLGAGLLAFAVFAGAGVGLWSAFQLGERHPAPPGIPVPGEVATIPLSASPADVAVASDGTAWVALPNALAKIDRATGEVTEEFGEFFAAKPGDLTGIAIEEHDGWRDAWLSDSGGYVWTVSIGVPPNVGVIIPFPKAIEVGGPAMGVAVGDGVVYATVGGDRGRIVGINANSEAISQRLETGGELGRIAVAGPVLVVQVLGHQPDLRPAIATVDPRTGDVRILPGGVFLHRLPEHFGVIDPETGQVLALPDRFATKGDEIWLSGGDVVERIDPVEQVKPKVAMPGAGPIAIGDEAVWVAASPEEGQPAVLHELDLHTGAKVGEPVPIGREPVTVSVGHDDVWIVNAGDGTITRVQLSCAGEPCAGPSPTPPLPGARSTIALPSAPTAMAAEPDGSILVTTGTSLYSVDPATNDIERLFHEADADLSGVAVVSYRMPEYPEEFVFAWLSDRSGLARWRILHAPPEWEATGNFALCCGSVDVGGPALGVAVGAGSVWVTVAHEGPGELVQIDPRTNEITGRSPTAEGPATVAVGEGGVWVQVTSGNPRLQRFDPSTGELVGEEGGDWFVAATADEAWGRGSDTVQRLMPTTALSVPIISPEPSGGVPSPSPDPSAHVPGIGPLTISGDQVWAVANTDPERPAHLYEIDRQTGDILGQPTGVGMTPTAVVVAAGSVWVANFNDPSLTRVQLSCGGSPCAGPSPPAPTPSSGATSEPQTSGPDTTGSLAEPPLPFIVGQTLVGQSLLPVTLGSEPDGRIAGLLSPQASFAGDHTLLYSTWTNLGGGGVIAHDLETGHDRSLRAATFAVRADGAVATSDWTTGDVISHAPDFGIWVSTTVATAGMGEGQQWLSGEHLVLVGWAGDTLLACRVGSGDTPTAVLAIDGPGQVRTLAESASVVAISPDGSRVLLAERPRPPERPVASLALVNIADGQVLAQTIAPSLIDPVTGHAVGFVEGVGDWTGETVVAPATDGTVLLHIADSSISVEQEIVVDSFPPLNEPQFIEGDPDRLIGWVSTSESPSGPEHHFWVQVDIGTQGQANVLPGPMDRTEPLRPVQSLSRPILPSSR